MLLTAQHAQVLKDTSLRPNAVYHVHLTPTYMYTNTCIHTEHTYTGIHTGTHRIIPMDTQAHTQAYRHTHRHTQEHTAANTSRHRHTEAQKCTHTQTHRLMSKQL